MPFLRHRTVYPLILSLLLLCLFVSGCATSSENDNRSTPQTSTVSSVTSNNPTTYPLTVKDASGLDVTFAQAPQRIISIAPSITEVLFALQIDTRIVGVDDWSDEPQQARAKPKVGGIDASLEKIVSLKPDIVFAGWTMSRATIEGLRAAGVPVFATEPRTIDDTIAHIAQLGTIVNRAAQATAVIATMQAQRKKVADLVKTIPPEEKKRVYIEFSEGWTVGPGEFMDELIREAGGINVATTPGWQEMSAEVVIRQNPQVILFAKGVEQLETTIRKRNGWEKLDALVQNRVVGIDNNVLSRPGPRLTEGLLQIAQALYPQ